MEINFALGKNGGYLHSSLGGRSITVGGQAAGRQAGRPAGMGLEIFNFSTDT